MDGLQDFIERLEKIPAVQEGAFSVRRYKRDNGTIIQSYEARETVGRLTQVRAQVRIDKAYQGVELKIMTAYGEATVEYPMEFSISDEKGLLNQEIKYSRFEIRSEENFPHGGVGYQREYKMNILSGELTGSISRKTSF